MCTNRGVRSMLENCCGACEPLQAFGACVDLENSRERVSTAGCAHCTRHCNAQCYDDTASCEPNNLMDVKCGLRLGTSSQPVVVRATIAAAATADGSNARAAARRFCKTIQCTARHFTITDELMSESRCCVRYRAVRARALSGTRV